MLLDGANILEPSPTLASPNFHLSLELTVESGLPHLHSFRDVHGLLGLAHSQVAQLGDE